MEYVHSKQTITQVPDDDTPVICYLGVLTNNQCLRLTADAVAHLRPDFRTSFQEGRDGYKFVEDTSQTRILREFLSKVSGQPLEHIEGVEVVRYQMGSGYPTHHDGVWRTHTLLVYLNEMFHGGETDFPILGRTITPQTGKAVCWINSVDQRPHHLTSHGCKRIDYGVKWVAVCWAWDRPVDRTIKSGVNPDDPRTSQA